MVSFSYVLMTLLGFSGLFLIGLILLQRGRGGGLAGAFGGMGGQSAGTKAGDVFTRITIGVASVWILLCAGSVLALHNATSTRYKAPDVVEPVKKAAPNDAEEAPINPPKDDNPKEPLKEKAPAGEKGDEKQKDNAEPDNVKPKENAEKPEAAEKPEGAADGDKKPDDAKPELKNPEPKPE